MDARAPDEDLERAWKAGSLDAFAELFRRHHLLVFRFAHRIVRDAALAEDVTQRAFLNLFERPPAAASGAKFTTLLLTVARNVAINEAKSRARRRAEALPEAARDGREPDPFDLSAAGEEAGLLAAALEALPAEDREAILLHERDGLSYREIAAVVGATVEAVRWRIGRALKALRGALAPAAPERDEVAAEARTPRAGGGVV
jgi:RNA polymerase sigma-70 factor (ECF subfamily)